jgi:hypothetical protein
VVEREEEGRVTAALLRSWHLTPEKKQVGEE